MEFPKPDCTNCGHVNDIGQCSRKDGQCKHIYMPKVIEHVFTPVKFHRGKEAMEYDRVINRDGSEESVAKGKLILSSNELWEVFHTHSDRAKALAKWCEKNVISNPDNMYISNPQPFEMDEEGEDDQHSNTSN